MLERKGAWGGRGAYESIIPPILVDNNNLYFQIKRGTANAVHDWNSWGVQEGAVSLRVGLDQARGVRFRFWLFLHKKIRAKPPLGVLRSQQKLTRFERSFLGFVTKTVQQQ